MCVISNFLSLKTRIWTRLDKFRPIMNNHNDAFFEFHIYFDDAFKDVENGEVRHVNEYAEILVEVIKEVYT